MPLPSETDQRPVAVIGAGTLGRRIALMMATRGGVVRIFDPAESVRDQSVEFVREHLPSVVRDRGGDATIGTVSAVDDLVAATENAWLVIEAVPERLDLKRSVFAQLSELAPADAILASNSSSYPSRQFIDEVADPSRVLNMHFYMPPEQAAVDLMSCGKTDAAVIQMLQTILPTYGVYPFVAHTESTGFIFNRIWAAIKREALRVVADGVSTPADIDAMMKVNTGMSIGVFEAMDRVGLDVVLDIENHYAAADPTVPDGPRRVLHEFVDAGRLGVKTGDGFFRYDASGNRLSE